VPEDLQAKDLRKEPPRRWSDDLGGVRWLPRLIDKARAAVAGTLGDYLYGQDPLDRSLLRALGIDYRTFTGIVRKAGCDDEKVLELLLDRVPHGLDLAHRWSDDLPKRYRALLFLIDGDDGYGAMRVLTPIIRLFMRMGSRYIRYRWPARAAALGLEIDAQQKGDRAEAARGAEEEPYRWLTATNIDASWKILLSVVLIFLMFTYVIRFIERIGVIFLIIIGAIFFAYLIYPIVRWLNKRVPLLLAILIVYAVIAGAVTIGLIYLIPAISAEVQTLVRDWPAIQTRLISYVRSPNSLTGHLPVFIRNELAKLPSAIAGWLQTHGLATAGSAFTVLLTTAAFIGACVAIPVLAAYLLYDSEAIKRFFIGFIPSARREGTLNLLSELEKVIGGFIRGQILVGASVGTLIAIGLTLVGEPYAILIGALAAAFDLIPYIGPVIAAVPAVLIGFVAGGVPLAVKAIVVFVIANQCEGHIIAPNIVSRTIKLSPSTVIVAILIGGDLYGVVGMFIAVPVAGIIRVIMLHVIPGSVSREEARPVLTKDPHEQVEEAAAP
jgi:predicted PurR-regulated permease PerM